MLCPGCGTSVGEKLQYCENCKSLQQVTAVESTEEEKTETENQAEEVSMQELLEAENSSTLRIIEKIFFGLTFFAVILAFITILYYRKNDSSKPGVPEITEISHDSSSLTFAGKKVDLLSNIAMYDRKSQIMEIAFFNGNLTIANEDSLKSLDSLMNISNLKPDVVLSFKFKNSEDCNMANVSQAKVLLSGLNQDAAITTVPVEFNSNFDPNSATAFGTLNCDFQARENLNGQFKISLKLEEPAPGNNTLNLDLKSKVKLMLK